MQNHWGVYRRRRGDDAWTDISRGLPSRFGFGMAAHPHDAGTVYTVPLEADTNRSEEHTSELQSLMRISYAVFCLKKKKAKTTQKTQTYNQYNKEAEKND